MKYCLVAIGLFTFNMYSQKNISIEQRSFYSLNNKPIPSSVREINDVNGVLDKFIGDYKADHTTYNILIKIRKKREYNMYRDVTEDLLEMNIYVRNLSNNLIISTEDEGLLPGFRMSYSSITDSYKFHVLDACGRDLQVNVSGFLPAGAIPARDGSIQKLEFWATNSTSKGPLLPSERVDPNCVSIANYLPFQNIVIFERQ